MHNTWTIKDALKLFEKLSNCTYEFVTYKIQPFVGDPLGFLSEHSQLEIHATTVEKETKVWSFFMKSMPRTNGFHEKYITDIQVFEKEARLYNILNDLQSYSDIKLCAKCYLTDVDSYIVLEDLSKCGYIAVKEKSVTLDLEHCVCVIQTLARFHAASIILEENNSTHDNLYRIGEHFPNALFETTFSYTPGHPRNNWLNTTTDALINVSKLVTTDRHSDIETRLLQFKKDMKTYISPSKTYRNVINHADLWSNNFMFKYEENGAPLHCTLVDFQMARYVPPAFDLLTFLYLNTTEQFAKKYFRFLADLYYDIFTSQLRNHDINADDIYTKDMFMESCNLYKAPALLEATMFGTIVYLNGDFSKDMLTDPHKFNDFMLSDRSKFVCDLFQNDSVYRERITNVLTQLLNVIL